MGMCARKYKLVAKGSACWKGVAAKERLSTGRASLVDHLFFNAAMVEDTRAATRVGANWKSSLSVPLRPIRALTFHQVLDIATFEGYGATGVLRS